VLPNTLIVPPNALADTPDASSVPVTLMLLSADKIISPFCTSTEWACATPFMLITLSSTPCAAFAVTKIFPPSASSVPLFVIFAPLPATPSSTVKLIN